MTIQTFFLAMACFPEAQRKAQAELDAVVGADRLCDFIDCESLTYVSALYKEVLRWHTVTPLGVAHHTSEDCEYKGYRIPKGTIVLWNSWYVTRSQIRRHDSTWTVIRAFTQDSIDYPDPEVFNPDRFLKDGKLNSDVRDPNTFAFGYGRRCVPCSRPGAWFRHLIIALAALRMCPGHHFADAELLMLFASVLHAFDIGPPLDDSGRALPLEPRFITNQLLS